MSPQSKIKNRKSKIALLLIFLLSACAPSVPATLKGADATLAPSPLPVSPTSPPSTQTAPSPTLLPLPSAILKGADATLTPSPEPSATASFTSTPDTRLPPDQWQTWPILPAVSARARQVYLAGLAAGHDPHHFSKIGDCQNITSHFLAAFDLPGEYNLGQPFAYLQDTIDYFAGSWGRESQTVRPGYNVAAVLSTFQADPKACRPNETPLDCEVRLYNPSMALISMETWYAGNKLPDYEKYLRQVIDYLLKRNILPILATKADNLEGNQVINRAIAGLATEYDLPLWNFWRAVQPLPGAGLVEDGFHLTRDPTHPADPLCYRRLADASCTGKVSWAVRNLTALEVIDAVRKGLGQ